MKKTNRRAAAIETPKPAPTPAESLADAERYLARKVQSAAVSVFALYTETTAQLRAELAEILSRLDLGRNGPLDRRVIELEAKRYVYAQAVALLWNHVAKGETLQVAVMAMQEDARTEAMRAAAYGTNRSTCQISNAIDAVKAATHVDIAGSNFGGSVEDAAKFVEEARAKGDV